VLSRISLGFACSLPAKPRNSYVKNVLLCEEYSFFLHGMTTYWWLLLLCADGASGDEFKPSSEEESSSDEDEELSEVSGSSPEEESEVDSPVKVAY
jgi:hypothetical protein